MTADGRGRGRMQPSADGLPAGARPSPQEPQSPQGPQSTQGTAGSGQQERKLAHATDLLPSVSVPKGGGAIRGLGEKFSVDAATGTARMSVPLPFSPGRSGFTPPLQLVYDSGQGNGPLGIGWNLGIPAITRKTDKGLPRYCDGEESDVFILAGAEDLVPIPIPAGQKPWPRTVYGTTFTIRFYRP